jgi:hypothetical protein
MKNKRDGDQRAEQADDLMNGWLDDGQKTEVRES